MPNLRSDKSQLTRVARCSLHDTLTLAQARARVELRDVVTEQDGLDVVELLHESLLDAFTLESGELDLFNKSGKMGGLQKQIKVCQSHVKFSMPVKCRIYRNDKS